MLMYRQIRPENADVISVSNFPPHIKDIMRREREKEEEERKQKEIDRLATKRTVLVVMIHFGFIV